jgi:nicotinamidase-related amidase
MARALIVVDVQNDFTEGGPFSSAFSFEGDDACARRIGSYVADHQARYDLVVTTQDWHIDPGEHFTKHPVHCVAATVGDALAQGYAVRLLTDLSAATTPEAAARVEAKLSLSGAVMATTAALAS